jgi:ribonucleoside-diphosphate reductase alpha chain
MTLGLRRQFTTAGVHPYEEIGWERRDARIVNALDGSVAFEQLDVEVPAGWSTIAVNILAQKYFRGALGTDERERSLTQVIDRIVGTIVEWGTRDGYFATPDEAQIFRDELTHLLVTQKAAFNSPVWFNIGVRGVPQQASACFILSVEDTMPSILEWYVEEGTIFKGGSGSGVNLSRIRSSREPLTGGGTASGPVSFMRGADASAGTIKSGGKTRRAAKMVVLDGDHPDVVDFVWCKAREERKARALAEAGFDVGMDGADAHSVQYQNANNSVRLDDAFMRAAVGGDDWDLVGVADGETIETLPARSLLEQIAQAAWECADPGVQFDTTINRWHTTPAAGRINASNPCSEYLHLDDSACNLASINLLAFDGPDGFDVQGFSAAARVLICAQEILVGNADYPTEAIAENARRFRQLGLGYANLGALLMTRGLPYDSVEGRALAATITALMTGEAYTTSARLAGRMGPFAGYAADAEGVQRVLGMHREAVADIDEELVDDQLLSAAQQRWDEACELAEQVGVRNAQVSVLAPTGTIGLLMDCDTTGIEPDLGLVKTKQLVGGGTMTIVNQSVGSALRALAYPDDEVEAIVAHLERHGSLLGAPHLASEHLPVFACSMGEGAIAPSGHVAMMAAVQPFLSGGISKTVNLPEETTVEEVEELIVRSWQMGIKALAIYRDNCKVSQPLRSGHGDESSETDDIAQPTVPPEPSMPVRQRLPRSRQSRTFDFRVADCKGFVTVGQYDDGRPGEIFVRVSKQGSTLAGIMDAFAISISYGLQYGVPLRAYVETFTNMRFEPAGMTDDPDIRFASSLMDYLFRRLALEYLTYDERRELRILAVGEREQPTLPGVEEAAIQTVQGSDAVADPPSIESAAELSAQFDRTSPASTERDAPMCMTCGVAMSRAGSCFVCGSCGSTSGCS